jgi:glycosyltransferase involved in cell wall biosynthesis
VKVLHVVYSYPPDPPGGTEIYVATLVRALQGLGVSSVIAAPASQDAAYEHEGTPVRRFATMRGPMPLEALYGVDDAAAASFARVLDDERPRVLHMHALTSACSSKLIDLARARGIATVLTYHTPTVSCTRGTLMRFGASACEGRLDVRDCTACTLEGLGAARSVGHAVSLMPRSLTAWAGRHGTGGAWTALRMPSLVSARHQEIRRALGSADRVVSLTPWVARVLQINGVTPDKIVASAHGVDVPAARADESAPSATGRVRLVHLGRLDPAKGTAVLLRALRAAPDLPIDLDVFGVVQSETGTAIRQGLDALADGDDRIRLRAPLPHADVMAALPSYAAVVVPSQGMETGPLVVPEAFAAGVPVVGSHLGGIADKVRDGVDGLLVRPHDSPVAWGEALRRLVTDAQLLPALRRGVRPPRSMADVAADMTAIYRELGARAQGRRAEAIA